MNQNRWKIFSSAMRRVNRQWSPPPRLTVSQWADKNRRLSSESSAEPGRWNTARAPYQREMMDVANDPTIRLVTGETSSQIGKTEVLMNVAGFHIELDPCPIMVLLPTLDLGKAWSKDRLAPMLRDSPSLKGKVKEVRSRSSENSILHKKFAGGHITIAGANSPASLSSRPIRITLADEVSRYPFSAGKEGSPLKLAEKRTVNFYNRQNWRFSTPTLEGCTIDSEYEASDKRKYWVKCPHCGEMHLLDWKNVVWEKDENEKHLPETAAHACPHCGALQTDADKPFMLANGEWRKEHPEVHGHAGFWINTLYSPWVRFGEMVAEFLKAKDDVELLQVFVNTALAEVWRDGKNISEAEQLLGRRENYTSELVPYGGALVTVTVDVQEDRLEVDTVAWGLNKETWAIEHPVIYGDPARPDVWKILDDYLTKTFDHESGKKLRIVACGIDSGYCTSQVYDFCKSRWGRRVYALKGDGGARKPLVSKPSKNNSGDVKLFRVGVDTAKDLFAHHLAVEKPGPGFCHFPANYTKDYFEQLLAERPSMKTVGGERIRVWVKKRAGIRNEALDNRVYHYAVLEILGCDLNATVQRFLDMAKVTELPAPKPGRRYRSKGVAA